MAQGRGRGLTGRGRGKRRPEAGQQVRPDLVLDAVAHLTADDLRRLAPDVTALCFDIDGTVTDYHAPHFPAEATDHLRGLAEAGYRTFVVSNCYGERAREVHRLFGRHVTAVFTPEDCVDPADPHPNPRKHGKPAPDMVLAATRHAQAAPHQVLMVGDQMFKDVVAARRAGTRALLVPRLGPSDHVGVRYLQRPLERIARPLLGLPGPRNAWPHALTAVL